MILSVTLLLVAIALSVVAAYYSIAGLITIFAAAVIPVIVMASVLEVAKVLTAAWLSHNWKRVNFFLKSYLTLAVIVLMFITSLGIFGFLSKAHIEQTAGNRENVAQIEIVEKNIARLEESINEYELQIEKIENSDMNKNAEINSEISKEESRVESAIRNYQLLVDEQNEIISSAGKKLELIEKYIEENDIVSLQALVGTTPDGRYGPNTASKVNDFREKEEDRVDAIISSARIRINDLRDLQAAERTQSNELIDRLRSKIKLDELDEKDRERIENLKQKIIDTENDLGVLRNDKFEFEKEVRKIEAEVGPVKYVAEVLYDNVDEDILEDAVRFVILCLIFVFDPLAILLVIASTSSIVYYREIKKGTNLTHLSEKDFEQESVIPPLGMDMLKPRTEEIKKKPNFNDPIERWTEERLEDHIRLE